MPGCDLEVAGDGVAFAEIIPAYAARARPKIEIVAARPPPGTEALRLTVKQAGCRLGAQVASERRAIL
jgi:hypothetical protein